MLIQKNRSSFGHNDALDVPMEAGEGAIQAPLRRSYFSCKIAYFKSGAEGIRTPDLRRAKAALLEMSALI